MKCLSLFSGCGGLDLGMKFAGFDIVFANDSDNDCVKSHALNFKDVFCFRKDIEELTNEEIETNCSSSEIDVVVGGPPCPPFSKSRFYRKEMPRAFDDPSGRSTIENYFRVIDLVRPRAFVMENVHGLAYKVHKEAFNYIKENSKKLGYKINFDVLNAADYGVPQVRKRLFIVGVNNSLDYYFPKKTHQEAAEGFSQNGIKKWVTAGNVLLDLPSASEHDLPGHFAGGKHHELLKEVPPGDNYLYFTEERGYPSPVFKWRSRYWSFLLKLSPDKPSWTIQARRSNNMGPFHWNNRILTIDEVKRLQTFPDDWQLSGTIEKQWRQIGNAVPPLLAQKIGSSLLEVL